MFGKRKIAALVAEFLGTGVLTLLILSVQRSTIGVPFFIALTGGLALALLTFTFNAVSGAYFNPAITIGMWIARKITASRAALYIAVQLLGGWLAYYLFTYYTQKTFVSIGGTYNAHILIAEAVASGIFALGWASTVYQNFTPTVRSAVAGLSYTVGIIAASSAAIGLLNPAVALGARAWVWGTYVLGPVLGAIIGVNLYGMLFAETEVVAVAAAPVAAKTVVSSKAVVAVKKPAAKRAPAKKPAAKRKTTAKK